jgi:hypothetical protein
VAPPGLASELHEHPDQGSSFGQAGRPENQVGDERVLAAPVPQREQTSKTENPAPAMKIPNAASSDQK